MADERLARELVEQRNAAAKEKAKAIAPVQKVTLENLFSQMAQTGEMKELAIDRQGGRAGLRRGREGSALEKLSNEEVRVRVIHAGVGAINESDVDAGRHVSNAIIVGFNVRPDNAAPEERRPPPTWICGCTASSTTPSTTIEPTL